MTPARTVHLLADEETKLIDNVFQANAGKKCVTFTSPDRGSGCSWLVSRIAERLKQRAGAKVCVVEAKEARIAELANEFDYVLVDASASEAASAGRLTDGVVMVLAANATQRDAAISMRMTLEAANIPILGAVLNKRTFPIPDRIFKYL